MGHVELGDPPKLRIPGLSIYGKKVNSEAGEQCGGGGRKLGCRICSDWWLLTWMGGVTCMTTNVIG